MKALIICLFLSYSPISIFCQEFNLDSCDIYYKTYRDRQLLKYLKKDGLIVSERNKAKYFYYLGIACRLMGDHDGYLENLINGFEIAKRGPDSILWKYLDELAISYKRIDGKNNMTSLDFINQSLTLKLKSGAIPDEIAKSYMLKGNLMFSDSAIESHLDSAIYYFKLAKEYNTIKDQDIMLTKNLSLAQLKKSELDSVENNLLRVINFYKEKGYSKQVVSTSIPLAGYYALIGSYSKADNILDSLYQIMRKDNSWKVVKRDLLIQMIYSNREQSKWRQVSILQDSLFVLNQDLNSTRLDDQITKYELENELIQTEFELIEAKAKEYKNRFWLSILLGTTGTLCLILFSLYKYLGLRRRAVEKELEYTRTKAAFETTKAKMQGEQQERESIASVLHDQVASLLTAADMHLKVAQKDQPELRGLKEAGVLIKDINAQVRDLSHQLVSPTLTKFGLEAGLDTLTDRMETAELTMDYYSDLGPGRFESAIETFVFQSCSELMQNVLKHSNADTCKVRLRYDAGWLRLMVSDNGDNSQMAEDAPTGLGLTHIYNRAAALGGSFVFSINESGAESRMEVPAVADSDSK